MIILKLLSSVVMLAAVERGPDVSINMPDDEPAAVESASSEAPAPAEAPMSSRMKKAFSGPAVNPFKAMQAKLDGKWDFLNDPTTLTDVLSQMHFLWALIFSVTGVLCVTNGYKWHRGLIVLLAAILGVYSGTVFGERIGSVNIVAACTAVLFAVVAWPMLRYSVALFGGLAGAFAGANAWTALGFPTAQHQYGAVIGLIVVGMLAFMAFRVVVILLTSIGGSAMLVMGAIAALMEVQAWKSGLLEALTANHLVVPIITASVAAIGMVYQFGGGVTGLNAMAAKADPKAVPVKKAA